MTELSPPVLTESNPTIAVREGEELNVPDIDTLLKARIAGLEGTPTVRQFASGHSNLTYLIRYSNRDLVLRRPPFGTRPKSGHSMIREFRVMNALKPVFEAVPQTCFHHPEEDSPLDAEFYVMERVPGAKLGRDIPVEFGFSPDHCRTLCRSFMDKLIDLHQVDYEAIGLGDFGRPRGYVERQITGWNGRFENAITDDVEPFEDVRAWLAGNRPETESGYAILHGDYRLDNVILDEENPLQIRAILDWEISALGDPMMDLGNTLAYWMQDDDPEGLLAQRMQPSNAPGMLSRSELLEHYAKRTGADLSGFDFYLVAGVFRVTAILQQIYFRYYHGETRNPAFAGFATRVNVLGNHCRSLIERA